MWNFCSYSKDKNTLKDSETFTIPRKNINCIKEKVNLDHFQRSAKYYSYNTEEFQFLQSVLCILKTEYLIFGFELTRKTIRKILRKVEKVYENSKIAFKEDENWFKSSHY